MSLSKTPLGCLVIYFVLLVFGAPWYIMGVFGLPALLWAPGWGWAQLLNRNNQTTRLQLLIDSAWIGLAFSWVNIAIIREVGLGQSSELPFILGVMSACWMVAGLFLAKEEQFQRPLPRREKIGGLAVVIAVAIVIPWRFSDITRPLDRYWYLDGADDSRNEYVALEPSRHWVFKESIGWPEAGAMRLIPQNKNPDFVAEKRINGRVVFAVRGPIGSTISAGDKRDDGTKSALVTNTVKQSMSENVKEGEVRRYLQKGVAAISVWVDLQPGDHYGLNVEGDEVYLLKSVDALWALHATGTLRFVHYYQILNQVENQVWAEEMLANRRFTWHQPPAWSPILAVANTVVMPDLPGAASLFLWVLVLLGLSSVRLASIAVPRASDLAYCVPAALVLVHALLMLEPGSFNFPDSLYAVAILGIVINLLSDRGKEFAFMGICAQALRWPGGVVATIFWVLYTLFHKKRNVSGVLLLWGMITAGVIIAGIAMLTGDAEDLLFVLYFETFPEHWHGNYNPRDLLARVPGFYGTWALYTGGILLLCLPFLFGKADQNRKNLRVILGGAFVYSLLLATIDHHPSHYFLPLVALSGPAFMTATQCVPDSRIRQVIVWLGMIGIGVFLWNGIVY